MFGYLCIVICFVLARYSRQEYRVISYLMLVEFIAHKLAFVFGDQLTPILRGSPLYLTYIIIELVALIYIRMFQFNIIISTLVFTSLVYNALVVSQYSYPIYDYMESYGLIMGIVMILELIYLGCLTAYVANFRRKQGFISVSHIDRLFFIRRGRLGRHYFEGVA